MPRAPRQSAREKMAADSRPHPLDVMRRAAASGITSVVVACSCGKDAAVTLALCREFFSEVQAYFMYTVQGISFQEKYLAQVERRYGIKIYRVPHWAVTEEFRLSVMRHPTPASKAVPRLTIRDIENHVRKHFGIEWFATGERCSDSIERNAVIKKANGIDPSRRRIWPVAFWRDAEIYTYLTSHQIPLASDYGLRGAGSDWGGSLLGRDLLPIKQNYPEDYRKILEVFPLAEARVVREEIKQARMIVNGQEKTRRRHN